MRWLRLRVLPRRGRRVPVPRRSRVPRGRVAGLPRGRVAGLPRGRAAAWPGCRASRLRVDLAIAAQLAAASAQQKNLKRARPSTHPKASLLSALGITRRPCGVPPLLPANPFTIELEIERSRLAGPGCPGRRLPAVPGEVIPSVCTLSEPAAPSSTAQALAMVRAGLGYLSSCDAAELGTPVQAEALIGLEQAEAQHTAARAQAAGRVQRPAGASGRWAVRAGGLAAGLHPRHQRRRRCGGGVGPAAGRPSADRRRAGGRAAVGVVGEGGVPVDRSAARRPPRGRGRDPAGRRRAAGRGWRIWPRWPSR